MNTSERHNVIVQDLTARVVDNTLNPPITLSDTERFSIGAAASPVVFSLTKYKFKGAYTTMGDGPHVPFVWLRNALWDTVVCTNGTMVAIDRATGQDSQENNFSTVGTNGNFGGVGQPATPPIFANAPTDGKDTWTFTLTMADDDTLEVSAVSDDPVYAGISWGTTLMKTGCMAGPLEVWFGVIDPVLQQQLFDYGYSGQYEIGRGVAGPILTAYNVV